MNIVMLEIDNIKPASWRTGYILRPEYRTLRDSMIEYGWLSPILVRAADYTIIDGFARWQMAGNDKKVASKVGTQVPVVLIDCDETDAMIMHVRMNRSSGQPVAKLLSRLIRRIDSTKKYSDDELRDLLGMGREEFTVLIEGSLLKSRKLKEYKYSKAWIPVEVAPEGAMVSGSISIERPPTPDK
jgi:ParB-like chromosome segregation protein Spo0J